MSDPNDAAALTAVVLHEEETRREAQAAAEAGELLPDDLLPGVGGELMPLRKNELPKPREFEQRLASFCERLPRGINYAVELRNRELFTPGYLDALRASSVAHVLSFWERMPDVGEQLSVPDVLTAPFVVSRLLIPPGQRYDARKGALALLRPRLTFG